MAARQRKYVVEQQDIDEPEHDAFSEVQHDTESPVTASGPEGEERVLRCGLSTTVSIVLGRLQSVSRVSTGSMGNLNRCLGLA